MQTSLRVVIIGASAALGFPGAAEAAGFRHRDAPGTELASLKVVVVPEAARSAAMGSLDWGLVASRVGLLSALVAPSAWFATRAFGVYQRSL
jgi:hypothetical protein